MQRRVNTSHRAPGEAMNKEIPNPMGAPNIHFPVNGLFHREYVFFCFLLTDRF